MKKSVYKPGIILVTTLFLLSLTISAQEVTKEYHKEYTAKQGAMLDLSNRYGDIIVQTSENNQVVIDVKVTVRYPNQERAEKLLSYIEVKFAESEDLISAKTVIDEKFSFSGWSGESRKFTIDYNVKMPSRMDLTLANRYGNTDLDELKGFVNLNIKYGNITASKLSRENEKPLNVLSLAYGKGTIDEAGWLDATIMYSGNFTVTKSQALLLASKYSSVYIGTTSSIVGETKYDKVRVESVNNLVLDAGYADINIGLLSRKLVFEGGYGSFNLDRVPGGFESLEVDTRYMGVRIGIDESASYNLDAKVSYGGLKFNEENFRHKRHIVENTSSETTGIVGKEESPSSNVKVLASYGTVRLY
ncbi:MAG: hypothetical protein MUO72_09260 [Bacteroidales bacterium]|nr:hypothetical protein [Bacteroidales bacterium]